MIGIQTCTGNNLYAFAVLLHRAFKHVEALHKSILGAIHKPVLGAYCIQQQPCGKAVLTTLIAAA